MAALEYLTQNSLTSHPFKNSYGLEEGTGAVDGWFYDILFVSYDDSIRRVYLQKIEKKENGSLEIGINNAETLARLPEGLITIAAEDVVDHYANKIKSFVGVAKSKFAIKFVIGPTLAAKEAFSENYLPAVTELSSDVTVLNTVRVNSITFEAYDGPILNTVKLYTGEEIALVEPRYNSTFTLTDTSSGELSVSAGSGAGLYDNCPTPGSITDVHTLNEIPPNSEGTLFLHATECHSLNLLTTNDELIYGDQLDTYRSFTSPGNTEPFNAVNPEHTITLENFCSVKCPHENVKALAYYINRITDGASGLADIAVRNTETRGIGSAEGTEFHVDNADFCDAAANIFLKCPVDSEAFIPCNQGFIKYLHEGRTLQVSYDNATITNYTIVSVINENTVLLDGAPSGIMGKIPFRVIDSGVISNINCASSLYNKQNDDKLKPYFKVRYSTSEAFNSDFEYVTYAAISVGVFNPGPEPVRLNIAFNPNGLGQQGSFKIRKTDSIYVSSESVVDLDCKEHAFVEAVYYIKCGEPASNFSILVTNITANPDEILGDGAYYLPPLVGVSCPGDIAGAINTVQIVKQDTDTFSQIIGVDPLVQDVKIYGTLPDWLTITFQPAQSGQPSSSLVLTGTKISTNNYNTEYNLYARYTGIAIPVVSQLVIQYVAPPIFIYPTEKYFTQEKPLVIDPLITYTEENPLTQLTVKNMDKPLSWNGDNFSSYGVDVIAERELPQGLTLDTVTGKITGRLLEGVTDEGYWKIALTATNPAGIVSQNLYLGVSKRAIPVISFLQQLPTVIDNYTQYTIEEPLCSFKATNDPILLYQTTDKLPSGLRLDTTKGVIYGKITETAAGTKTINVYARNFYGKSILPLEVTISYTIYKQPEIQAPTQFARFNGEDGSTLEEPLCTIVATQAYGGLNNFDPLLTDATRNHYTATNLPPGFSVDLYTGKVYGILDTSEGFSRAYAVTLKASNLVNTATVQIYITFPNVKLPVITNLASGSLFKVTRNLEYSVEAGPLASIYAIYLDPIIIATGLPAGLTCLPTGEVVGMVDSLLPAGDYTVSFRAQNRYGVSTPAIVCIVRVGIELLSPLPNSMLNLSVNAQITPIQITTSQGVPVTLTVRNLPAGLTFNNSQIYGTPVTVGRSKIYITASAGVFGIIKAVINVSVSIPTYSLSGAVVGVDLAAATNVFLTITSVETGAIYTIKTTSTGTYQLNGLYAGIYNVSARKDRFEIEPITRTITIVNTDVALQSFLITGPYRLIVGTVTNAINKSGVENVAIITFNRTVYTDTAGRFFINLLQNEEITITADAVSYVFNPKTIDIPISNEDSGGYSFKATPSHNISGTIVSKNIEVPANIGVLIDNQNTGEKYYDIAPAGSISVQALDGKYKIYPNPEASDYYNSIWQFKPKYIPVEVNGLSIQLAKSFNIFSGKTISGRVIAPIYETEIGLPIPVAGVAITAANITLDQTRFIWLKLDANNPPTIKLDLKTIRAAAASTENIPVTVDFTTGFFNLRGTTAGQLSMDGYTASVEEIILLKDQFYPELNGIYTIVNPGSATETFHLVRSTEANYNESLKVGAAIYVIGGITNSAATYYLTTEDQVTAISDIDGNFTLTNVYPDTYNLYAHKEGVGILSIPQVNVSTNNATNLVIVPNTYQITGTIQYRANYLSTTKTPLTDVRISLYRAKDLFLLKKSEKSKADGSWIFRSVPDGDYILKAEFRGMTPTVVEQKITVDDGDVNLVAMEVYIAVFTAPSAPIVNNIQGGYRSLKVTVSENPEDIGTEIRYYEYSLDSGTTWATAVKTSDSEILIPDLPPAEKTIFKLRARNLWSYGPEVELQGVAFDRPGAPTITSIARKNKELLVNFSPPLFSGGLYIDNYAYSTDGGITFLPITPANITGSFSILKRSNNGLDLVNGEKYQIVLHALAGEAAGLDSEPEITFPVGTPGPSRLLSVVGGRLNELDISFEPPEITNGAPVADYAYSLNGGPFTPLGTVNSPATITNLLNGTIYSVRVAAINSEGVGDASNSIQARVGVTADAPTIFKAEHAGGGKLRIYIQPGANGFSPITGYVYYIDSPEGGTENSNTATPLGGLTPDNTAIVYSKLDGQGGTIGTMFEESRLYTISIAAVNEFGTSIASEKISFFVVYTAPRALIVNSYIEEHDRVIFNLSFENNDTGGAGGYVTITSIIRDSDGNIITDTYGNPLDNLQTYYNVFTRSEYTYTVAGLTAGVTYDITILTSNAAGTGA